MQVLKGALGATGDLGRIAEPKRAIQFSSNPILKSVLHY
jgi:hypothetical protein